MLKVVFLNNKPHCESLLFVFFRLSKWCQILLWTKTPKTPVIFWLYKQPQAPDNRCIQWYHACLHHCVSCLHGNDHDLSAFMRNLTCLLKVRGFSLLGVITLFLFLFWVAHTVSFKALQKKKKQINLLKLWKLFQRGQKPNHSHFTKKSSREGGCIWDLVLRVYQISSVFLHYVPLLTSCKRFQRPSELPGSLLFTNICHLLTWPQLNPPSSFQSRNQSGRVGPSLTWSTRTSSTNQQPASYNTCPLVFSSNARICSRADPLLSE